MYSIIGIVVSWAIGLALFSGASRLARRYLTLGERLYVLIVVGVLMTLILANAPGSLLLTFPLFGLPVLSVALIFFTVQHIRFERRTGRKQRWFDIPSIRDDDAV